MSVAKRVYYYLVCLVTLGILASGVGILLRLLFDLAIKNPANITVGEHGFSTQQFSLGLAMLITGGLLWWLFWKAVQRNVSVSEAEIGSGIRKLYLNLIQAVGALVGLLAVMDCISWILGGVKLSQFPSIRLATFIVAAAVWYYHWRISEKEGQPTRSSKTFHRWYVYILSAWGLLLFSASLVQFINNSVLHSLVWGQVIIMGGYWNSSLLNSIAGIIIGGITWVFHWLYMARGDNDSTLRQVYLYLLAVSGGAIGALVAFTTLLYRVFGFIFAGLSASGSTYFQFLGWTIPLLLVSLAIWAYHQKLSQEESGQVQRKRMSARRVHIYLMSFISLGTLVAGLIMLMGVLLDLLGNSMSGLPISVSPEWWRNPLSFSTALLLTGTPLWLYYWNKVLQMVAGEENAESKTRSRRVFLYIILGISVITLATDLVNVVYQLLNGLLQTKAAIEILRGTKWSLQTLVVALPMLLFFWRIVRRDQRLGAEAIVFQKEVTVLVPDTATAFIERLEDKLGYRVKMLHTSIEIPGKLTLYSDDELNSLATEMQSASASRIMLVITASGWLVIPYHER
jgi:hypothetical protein